MLEVEILDNVELLRRVIPSAPLLALSPSSYLINGSTSRVITSGDSTVANSLGQALALLATTISTYPSKDLTKYWTWSDTPTFRTVRFDTDLETVAFDDLTGRTLRQIVEDASGSVWAQGSAAGFFGLWRRTGTATWTQVLTDSALATGVRYRASDNTYWYQSSTANHYSLANGVATLTSAPTGVIVDVNPNGGWRNLLGVYLSSTGTLGVPPTFLDPDNTSADFPPTLGHDIYLNAGGVTSVFTPPIQLRLNATYQLLVGTRYVSGAGAYYYFYLWNKTTNICRFIGCVPMISVNAGVAPNADHMRPFAGKFLTSGGFRIYLMGSIAVAASAATAGNIGAFASIDVPYQPIF